MNEKRALITTVDNKCTKHMDYVSLTHWRPETLANKEDPDKMPHDAAFH